MSGTDELKTSIINNPSSTSNANGSNLPTPSSNSTANGLAAASTPAPAAAAASASSTTNPPPSSASSCPSIITPASSYQTAAASPSASSPSSSSSSTSTVPLTSPIPQSAQDGLALFKRALDSLLQNSLVEVMEALETLLVYTKNLILFPDEKKYRKIKISNIHYQERLGHLSGALEAMTAIGYVPVGDYLRLDEKRMSGGGNDFVLKQLESEVNNKLSEVKKVWSNLPFRTPLDYTFQSVTAAGSHSAMGKRNTMEDDEIIVDKFCSKENWGYFGLYDGHGGRATVDFVVKALHMNLEQHIKRNPEATPAESFKHAYLATDGQLRRSNILRSGTTSVTCLVKQNGGIRYLHSANVGDSRAVLCRGGKAIRLTIDHKASLPEEAKRITDAGGFIGRNKRVNGVLAISRALGDHMLKENDVVSAEPYCVDTELKSEDTHVLLACDGVWDVMSDQEAVDFMLAKIKYYQKQAQEYKEKLAEGKENVSLGAGFASGSTAMETDNEKSKEDDEPNETVSEYPRHANDIVFFTAKALVREALDRRSLDNVTVMIVQL